jgi:7-cyano-7-deazaguanine synthase
VLLSGGIDSALCLSITKETLVANALTFEYHGIAKRELDAARAVARWAGVKEHRFVRLPDLREAEDIAGAKFEGLPPTYIPSRNAVFYSLASSFAEEIGASRIVGGHNLDDAAVFDDVSGAFFRALERALRAGSPSLRRNKVRIVRPLADKTKPQVVRLAASKGVPLELTWSCHKDGEEHCWNCPGCVSRRDSFREGGVKDPLLGDTRTKIT